MCGINILIDKTTTLNEESIVRMNQAILHRGPDHTGFIKISHPSFNIFMGVNRLAIADLSDKGAQPMSIADTGFYLCFNGEIYNHSALRQKLKATCTGTSDTETLIYGLYEKGAPFLNELDGMFALAYWNPTTKTLLLARDQQGIKPLYYYEDAKYFIASSEIRGILASGLVKKNFNSQALPHYLLRRYCQAPATFYENIKELLPGATLSWTSHSPTVTGKISIKPGPKYEPGDDLVQNVDKLLLESLRNQLPQLTQAGLLLSGGVDSSLLLAQLQTLGIRNFPVFSVSASKEDRHYGTDDFHYARLASQLYTAEQHDLSLDASALTHFDDYIKTIDQPVADAAGFLTWLISREAIQHVQVVFSGAGADEYFAGYNRHLAFYHYLKIAPIGTPLLNKLAIFPETHNIPFRKDFRLVNKLFRSIDHTPQKTWNNFTAFTIFQRKFLKTSISQIEKDNVSFDLNAALHDDRHHYLPYDILKITDNASMAVGLEARVPYLDRRLVSYVSGIPPEILLKRESKWILKTLLKKKGGAKLLKRPKEGFGIPFNKWLLSSYGKPLTDLLRNTNNPLYEYLDKNAVDHILNAHTLSKRDYSGELYSLTLLSAWLQKAFT